MLAPHLRRGRSKHKSSNKGEKQEVEFVVIQNLGNGYTKKVHFFPLLRQEKLTLYIYKL